MIAFSPGLAQGCFELIDIAARNKFTLPEINSSFAHLGSIPAAKVIETAQSLKWLHSDERGIATVTPTGTRLLNISGYEPMLRQALLDYIDIECPPWVQNATFGRSRVISFAGIEIGQVFVEANLADGTNDDVVAFWDALGARARGQKNDRMTAIGRYGEKLSLAHEAARTGATPKWVAIDNNEDGYDVLSILSATDPRSMSIEVKTTSMGFNGYLFLTRTEWERATEVENHVFHLWALNSDANPMFAIATPTEMEKHVPNDLGDGSWKTVGIPFAAFKKHFSEHITSSALATRPA